MRTKSKATIVVLLAVEYSHLADRTSTAETEKDGLTYINQTVPVIQEVQHHRMLAVAVQDGVEPLGQRPAGQVAGFGRLVRRVDRADDPGLGRLCSCLCEGGRIAMP